MTARQKIWAIFGGVLLVVLFSLAVDYSNFDSGSSLGKVFNRFKVHLGLDLQGGAHLVYEADMKDVPQDQYSSRLEGVRDVIERRVNAFGIAEPIVQTTKFGGHSRVIVELPGISNLDEAIKMIGETPFLDFREEMTEEEEIAFIKQNFPVDQQEQLIQYYKHQENQYNHLYKPTELTGKYLKNSSVEFDQNGNPEVSLVFNDEGAKLFADITKRNIGKQVAIFLDGAPISEPRVDSEITGGRAVITGNFNIDEARKLSGRLNSGALPVPISLISQQTVGATLGRVALERSLIAGILGLLLVSLFMIIFYRMPGLLSVIALIFYTIIVYLVIKK